MNEMCRLLLGDECFDWYFVIDEGNEVGDRVQLQESIDNQQYFVEAGLLPPHSVRYGLKFWEVDGNVVFTEVNCPGGHAEDVRWVRGLGGIVMYAGMSGNDGYHRMVEIHNDYT